ncbi:IclR family transcriptional regulator [Solibacillus cecembensis]|uniref:IclR family transcriptional regulator n=1 Tax=Solibacillus cecembensis TaxID=459347 RepID=UPI0007171536
MNQETFEKNYTMSSLHKAIKVLKAFTKEEPSLSLTELSKKTGISISSLQRFVSTFVYEGFLHKEELTKRYQLGHSLLYLGNLVKQESSLIIVADPLLKKLNEEIGESVSMSIIDGLERRCILNYDSTYPLSTKMFVGDTSPLYAGASSKILLAFMPHLEQYLENIVLEPITNQTILSKDLLISELQQIRSLRYAKSNGERVRGACSVTAPILNASHQIIASVTILIPEVRYADYDEQQLIDSITRTALEIENQLY